jgi:hypothetical protein
MCVRAGGVHGTHSYSGYVESSYAKTVWGNHMYVHGGNMPCTNTVANVTFTNVWPQLQHGETYAAEYTMHVALVSNTDGLYPIARGACVKYGQDAYIKYHHGGDTGRGPLSCTICTTEAATRKTQAPRRATGYNIPATGPVLGPLRQWLKVREACWLAFRVLHGGQSELGESAIRTYTHVQYTSLSVSFTGKQSELGESVACTHLHVQYTLICVTKYNQSTGGMVPHFPCPSRRTIGTGRVCNAYVRKCKDCCIVLAVQDWERSLGLRHVQIPTRLRVSITTELNQQISCRSVSRLGTSCWGYEEHNSSFCAARVRIPVE